MQALNLAAVAGLFAMLIPNEAFASGGGSLAGLLWQTVVSLVVICGAAYLVLRFGLARWAKQPRTDARMETLEHLAIDRRHSLHLVRIEDRMLVLATTETGASLLTEFQASGPAVETETLVRVEDSDALTSTS